MIIKTFRTYGPLISRLRVEQARSSMYAELEMLAERIAEIRGLPVIGVLAP